MQCQNEYAPTPKRLQAIFRIRNVRFAKQRITCGGQKFGLRHGRSLVGACHGAEVHLCFFHRDGRFHAGQGHHANPEFPHVKSSQRQGAC